MQGWERKVTCAVKRRLRLERFPTLEIELGTPSSADQRLTH